jgi:hypothetical protein
VHFSRQPGPGRSRCHACRSSTARSAPPPGSASYLRWTPAAWSRTSASRPGSPARGCRPAAGTSCCREPRRPPAAAPSAACQGEGVCAASECAGWREATWAGGVGKGGGRCAGGRWRLWGGAEGSGEAAAAAATRCSRPVAGRGAGGGGCCVVCPERTPELAAPRQLAATRWGHHQLPAGKVQQWRPCAAAALCSCGAGPHRSGDVVAPQPAADRCGRQLHSGRRGHRVDGPGQGGPDHLRFGEGGRGWRARTAVNSSREDTPQPPCRAIRRTRLQDAPAGPAAAPASGGAAGRSAPPRAGGGAGGPTAALPTLPVGLAAMATAPPLVTYSR